MAIRAVKPQPAADGGGFRIRSLEQAVPEFAALLAKRDALNAELRQLAEEREVLLAKIREEDPSNRRQTRILQIVGDPVDGTAPISRERLAEIGQRTEDLEAAVKVVTERISTARYKASAIICDENEGTHRDLVRGICLKLMEAFKACQDYSALIDEFERRDVAWTRLRPMMPNFIFGNSGRDREAPVAQFLREAAEFGFLGGSEIPEALR